MSSTAYTRGSPSDCEDRIRPRRAHCPIVVPDTPASSPTSPARKLPCGLGRPATRREGMRWSGRYRPDDRLARLAGLLALIGLWVVLANNSFVRARNKVDEAWSGIDVELKRRHD